MAKFTSVHLGNVHIAVGLFFKEIGVDFVKPPINSGYTLELGKKISPQEICAPFKLMAGNLIQAYENGADTVIMPATMGPCRLGEYGELLRCVLQKNGYNFNWILIDSVKAIGIKELKKRLLFIISGRDISLVRAIIILLKCKKLQNRLDEFENAAHHTAGIAVTPELCAANVKKCENKLSAAHSLKEANIIMAEYEKKLKDMPKLNRKKPTRIILAGEIFTLIDSYGNHGIEEKLMKLGVSFHKEVTVSWWIKETMPRLGLRVYRKKYENKYLNCNIGGYAKETVREGTLCLKDNYDGLLQILPAGCMPEIVAKSALTKLASDKNMRFMTIIFDEIDGDAGYDTRIEAFIDMLEIKKRRSMEKKEAWV